MALTCQQIVSLALQDAKAPGFTAQAGQLLNVILQELAQTYDFDLAKGLFQFSLVADNGSGSGSGPYVLPGDYLRADPNDVFYVISGVPYVLVSVDINEYDAMVQQAGIAGYPNSYATDMSQSPPVMYVWPPASGAYPMTVRYRRQMADITAPESSASVPWFPNSNYLRTRLAGEVMKITDDSRWTDFLGDGPYGAQGILDRYLKMKDDKSSRTQVVSLDRRRFGNNFNRLPNTKTIGW